MVAIDGVRKALCVGLLDLIDSERPKIDSSVTYANAAGAECTVAFWASTTQTILSSRSAVDSAGGPRLFCRFQPTRSNRFTLAYVLRHAFWSEPAYALPLKINRPD
jgi:hypothetical protein